jgi:hypothetical protein
MSEQPDDDSRFAAFRDVARYWSALKSLPWPYVEDEEGLAEHRYAEYTYNAEGALGHASSLMGLGGITRSEREMRRQRLVDGILNGQVTKMYPLTQPILFVDTGVDEWLANAHPKSAAGAQSLARFRVHRNVVLHLYEALSAATGLPLDRRDRRTLPRKTS